MVNIWDRVAVRLRARPRGAEPLSRARYPWIVSYPPGVDWSAPLDIRPLVSLLDDAVARFADRPCIDFLGKVQSYGEIGDLVDRAANGLRHLGVGPGVKVGLCLPNTPYSVVFFFAVLKAGGTVVNYSPLNAPRELARQIEDSETEIMVTVDLRRLYRNVASLLGKTRLRQIVVCRMADVLPPVKGMLLATIRRGELAEIPRDVRNIPFTDLVNNDGAGGPALVDPVREVAVLQYTGGTTGIPKGAMLTHANLSANASQVLCWAGPLEAGEERFLGVLPLFHVFALTNVMLAGIALGAELVLLPRFELAQLLKTIQRARPTIFMGVPTLYGAIVAAPDLGDHDLSSIKSCISGGAPLPAALKRRFEELTGSVLVEGYGLTECGPVVACNPLAGGGREGSVGLPVPNTVVEVRSPDGRRRPLPPGENGEIWVAGPQVMAGYWRQPEATAKAIVGGFLRTGDIGYMDDGGHVFLVDRLKDVILCGGYNVYPRTIEEAIMLHPAVAEVAVIGVPDSYRGEAPKAFVRRHEGASLDEAELMSFLEDKLSPIERPGHVEFRDELPKTAIGKHSKKDLAAEEAARRAAAAAAAPDSKRTAP